MRAGPIGRLPPGEQRGNSIVPANILRLPGQELQDAPARLSEVMPPHYGVVRKRGRRLAYGQIATRTPSSTTRS